MEKIYLDQLYLPHYFIQGENVSPKLSDMDDTKPIRLQIFNYGATRLLADDVLSDDEIKYIRKTYEN